MKRLLAAALLVCATAAAQEAPIPTASELAGRPFAIQHKWIIGGLGDWDYLTLDAATRQLFIAHGPTVQVVDVESGSVAGTVTGLHDAHQVVLDSTGYGYVTDGPADEVKVFDRGTFEVVGSMPTGPQPRSLVLDPSSGLLLAICAGPAQTGPAQRATSAHTSTGRAQAARTLPRSPHGPLSVLSIIDPQARKTLAHIVFAGKLGFAEADGNGRVYVAVENANRIARFDVTAIGNEIARAKANAEAHKRSATEADKPLNLDWSGTGASQPPGDVLPYEMSVGDCQDPRGIAIDSQENRLFVACANQKMAVVDSEAGRTIASLTIGPGADAVAYDASRGLIFTANGGGYGSVSIVRQHVTDSYAVVQNLPTLAQARTLAVDPSDGKVYLVTTLYGARLGTPSAQGIGTLKMGAVGGSFQVLVVGR